MHSWADLTRLMPPKPRVEPIMPHGRHLHRPLAQVGSVVLWKSQSWTMKPLLHQSHWTLFQALVPPIQSVLMVTRRSWTVLWPTKHFFSMVPTMLRSRIWKFVWMELVRLKLVFVSQMGRITMKSTVVPLITLRWQLHQLRVVHTSRLLHHRRRWQVHLLRTTEVLTKSLITWCKHRWPIALVRVTEL